MAIDWNRYKRTVIKDIEPAIKRFSITLREGMRSLTERSASAHLASLTAILITVLRQAEEDLCQAAQEGLTENEMARIDWANIKKTMKAVYFGRLYRIHCFEIAVEYRRTRILFKEPRPAKMREWLSSLGSSSQLITKMSHSFFDQVSLFVSKDVPVIMERELRRGK